MMKYDYPTDGEKSFSLARSFALEKGTRVVFYGTDGALTKQREDH